MTNQDLQDNGDKYIKLCRKYQDKICILLQGGVFEIEAGRITIDVKPDKDWQSVRLSETSLWQKKKLSTA